MNTSAIFHSLRRCLAPAALAALAGAAFAQSAPQPVDEEAQSSMFRPAPIAWAPCAEFPALECGVLRLPQDYRQPHARSFGMAVVRAKATHPGKRIGVLFTNPGGPGRSGVNNVIGGVAVNAPIIGRLRERFDIIGFDPRGDDRSDRVHCKIEFGAPPVDAGDTALAAYFDDVGRRYAAACRQQNGDFVFTLSVNNVARDMEMLRRALSESQISYAGSSFGTQLGAVYASMFPKRVRAMVLDAGIAPATGGDSLIDFWTEHSAGFDFAFTRLDLLCQHDSRCPLQAQGVKTTFDALVARLKAAPVTVPGGVLTQVELNKVVGEALYRERAWPAIVSALKAALDRDYAPLLALDSGSGQSDGDQALTPTMCGSYAARVRGEDALATDATFTAAFPRFYGRTIQSLPGDRFGIAFALALCSQWPAAEETVIRNLHNKLAVSPLVIAVDFDNATPPAWSRQLASALGAPHAVLRYRGGGHGVAASGVRCTDDAIVAYLGELEMPPEGSVCAASPLAFAPRAIAPAAHSFAPTRRGR
jgi:pimeloyl-ACP methyl ester carboxylesterase